MKLTEQDLLTRLGSNDHDAFASLFNRYYKDLVLFAGSYVKDLAVCEDIVQSVFIHLWTGRREASAIRSLKPFLLKSVQNGCLSHLRHQNIRYKYAGLSFISGNRISCETEKYILYSELSARLEEALKALSPEQRQCFEMNRIKGMKQTEIAKELHMPLRTVELRIAESLKILKSQLKEYFIWVVLFLLP